MKTVVIDISEILYYLIPLIIQYHLWFYYVYTTKRFRKFCDFDDMFPSIIYSLVSTILSSWVYFNILDIFLKTTYKITL